MHDRQRTRTIACLFVSSLCFSLLSGCARPLRPTDEVPLPPLPPGAITVVAAGDIACDPSSGHFHGGQGTATWCQQAATAKLAASQDPKYVILIGDTQYESGRRAAYDQSFDKSWGQFRGRWLPAAGNHEYHTAGAAGYFDYFGAAAGDPKQGWYSKDIGKWHIVVLNSECGAVGGCGRGSAQEQWLRQDLANSHANCTLAVFHEPRFSSGLHGDNGAVRDFWVDLYEAGADVVLNGHDHDYEAFAPQTPDGRIDIERGIHEFVVGTGGKNHRGYLRVAHNSRVRDAHDFGVLRLDLMDDRYRWTFLKLDGTALDAGEAKCHGRKK